VRAQIQAMAGPELDCPRHETEDAASYHRVGGGYRLLPTGTLRMVESENGTIVLVSPVEIPILTIGEAATPHDHVTMTTYRWLREELSTHGPDDLILVSIGVWTGGTFYQDDRSTHIAGSEFIGVHESLADQLKGNDGTARISANGDAFSLGISSESSQFTVMGTITDSRSGGLEEFTIRGFGRPQLESAVRYLEQILEWFQLA
jgi:hypothetical protein